MAPANSCVPAMLVWCIVVSTNVANWWSREVAWLDKPVRISSVGFIWCIQKFRKADQKTDYKPIMHLSDDLVKERLHKIINSWCNFWRKQALFCSHLGTSWWPSTIWCYEICRYSNDQVLGAVSIRKTVLPGMAIPMLKIRRPNGRLIFNMEIAIRR